jgi:hypothetical protein
MLLLLFLIKSLCHQPRFIQQLVQRFSGQDWFSMAQCRSRDRGLIEITAAVAAAVADSSGSADTLLVLFRSSSRNDTGVVG